VTDGANKEVPSYNCIFPVILSQFDVFKDISVNIQLFSTKMLISGCTTGIYSYLTVLLQLIFQIS